MFVVILLREIVLRAFQVYSAIWHAVGVRCFWFPRRSGLSFVALFQVLCKWPFCGYLGTTKLQSKQE
eukprot:821164-Amphidinium_carterae.1